MSEMSKKAWRFWGASAMPLLFAICCVTTVAEAATVSLNKNSNNGFVAADGWNSGDEPEPGPTPEPNGEAAAS